MREREKGVGAPSRIQLVQLESLRLTVPYLTLSLSLLVEKNCLWLDYFTNIILRTSTKQLLRVPIINVYRILIDVSVQAETLEKFVVFT